jgi:hypothetical protein
MTRMRTAATLSLCLCAALLSFTAHAQEIRPVAQPDEAVRMAHGGYVCEGRTSITPIDNSYDTVSCSGPIYNAGDYMALYTKLNHDELVKMNANTAEALNRDIKTAIQKRFNELPPNLRQMAAIQNLERSLSEYVDERLPEGRGTAAPRRAHPPASHASAPGSNQ